MEFRKYVFYVSFGNSSLPFGLQTLEIMLIDGTSCLEHPLNLKDWGKNEGKWEWDHVIGNTRI